MKRTFEQYLRELKHSEQTIKSYCYSISIYLAACPEAPSYKYKDVLAYMNEKAKDYNNRYTKNGILAGIKKYYDYLVDIGERTDHPCRTLYLKGKRRSEEVIHADLFTSAELDLLLEREERYHLLKQKNQAVISLLIWQGLTAGELAALRLQHIDLDNGKIFVKESRTHARRYLDLVPRQYRMLDRYIHEARKELIKEPTDALILGKLGTPTTVDDINYLVSTFKPLFPDRNLNAKTIRQSVIANWLNEKKLPVEQVQLMAGHKWISSTARYRRDSIEEQRELMNKFHPLG